MCNIHVLKLFFLLLGKIIRSILNNFFCKVFHLYSIYSFGVLVACDNCLKTSRDFLSPRVSQREETQEVSVL